MENVNPKVLRIVGKKNPSKKEIIKHIFGKDRKALKFFGPSGLFISAFIEDIFRQDEFGKSFVMKGVAAFALHESHPCSIYYHSQNKTGEVKFGE